MTSGVDTPWDRRQIADAIEKTRRTSVYQGIGTHPVCLDDEQWKIVVEALRSETKWIRLREQIPLHDRDVLVRHRVIGVKAMSARDVRFYVSDPTDSSMADAEWMEIPK